MIWRYAFRSAAFVTTTRSTRPTAARLHSTTVIGSAAASAGAGSRRADAEKLVAAGKARAPRRLSTASAFRAVGPDLACWMAPQGDAVARAHRRPVGGEPLGGRLR